MRALSLAGKSRARPAITPAISLLARSIAVPGLRRMNPSKLWFTLCGLSGRLNQKFAPCGVSNARGATPVTVVVISAKRSALPTTAGSP